MIKKLSNKMAQEEMVGFALIIIVVGVILLVFLGLSLRSSEEDTAQSYEVDSFVQASLQYTTNCQELESEEYLSIQDLIVECNDNDNCMENGGEVKACDVLKNELTEIAKESWKIGEDTPYNGYELKINSNSGEISSITEGTLEGSSKGGNPQKFFKRGSEMEMLFKVYYD